MATECSSIVVAVRVRPFTPKEDSACCTVVVPDSTTISVFDIPALIPGTAGGGSAVGGAPGCTSGNDSGVSNSSVTVGLLGSTGGVTGGGRGMSFGATGTLDLLQHSYSFDKIFWSVAPSVLPFPQPDVLDAVAEDDKGVDNGGRRKVKLSTAARPTKTQRQLFSQYRAVAKHLPCFAPTPVYDDQQRVYEFIGPRMCEAAMSGFNTCLFAYGQTGSGKSYSMIGPTDTYTAVPGAVASSSSKPSSSIPASRHHSLTTTVAEEQGIMPRLCSDLFRLMREEREMDGGVTHSIELSLLEIYCEKVRDLLASSSSGAASNNSIVGAPGSAGGSLRVRQHPSQGPYVEGLSHVKVRDADAVLRYLVSGLRDRATAGTSMNDHSSRSHAILQLHIAKVISETDDNTSNIVTRTRTCKVNMVDLAGSERVSQSGVSGDRFEEARNINLSLSTLGRVIQQLSEKQAGKNVIPAYRDSVLTWLLSDSLGGNSKTIMLATVSPSAYCYQQTLNTLRFAGVAKKVVNIAMVNEDRHFQQLIGELRRQIVRLTLELESGKAAEVHLDKINALKQEREALLSENDALKVKVTSAADTTVLQSLRRRVNDLETENAQLRQEAKALQERMLTSTGMLREELAQQLAELIQHRETVARRDAEVTDWANRYRALVVSITTPSTTTLSAASVARNMEGGVKTPAAVANIKAAQKRLHEELKETRTKLEKVTKDLLSAERAKQEAVDAAKTTSIELDEYHIRYEETKRQLDLLHERMHGAMSLLDTTQCELRALKSHKTTETAKARAVKDALEVTSAANATAAAHLDQMRSDYLEEKQRNVQLLLRLAQVEQERSSLKRAITQREADTCELEQLVLEETETSERYYLRMRFHRYAWELQCQFITQMFHLRDMSKFRWGTENGMSSSPKSLTGQVAELSSTTCVGDDTGDRHAVEAAVKPFHYDPSSSSSTAWVAHEATFSAKLGVLQLVYECQCEESRARATVEKESAEDMSRILTQKVHLHQRTAASLGAKLAEVRDAHKSLHEMVQFYKQRVKTQEDEYAEEVAQHQNDSNTLQIAEMDRLRLQRKIHALEEVNSDIDSSRNLLITKMAHLQEQLSMWQSRCTEAEKISAEVQNLLFPSSPDSAVGSADVHINREGIPEGGNSPHLCSTYSALTSKARRAQDAIEANLALEKQCEEYRTEIGALCAQMEQMRSEKQTLKERLAQSDQEQQKTEARLTQANTQLAQEINTITRDYESRIKHQQTMMDTLRHALEEETSMADKCRQSAQRAEAARLAQEEELIAAKEVSEELLRQREATSKRYLEVHAEVDELRTRYHQLERRLLELREHEPELFVLLEKGLGEDTTSWLEKVRSEKMRLVKQRFEAQRLNCELLEHVQHRNTRLRDVQRRITNVSFAGQGATGDDEVPSYDSGAPQTPASIVAEVDDEQLGCTLREKGRTHLR